MIFKLELIFYEWECGEVKDLYFFDFKDFCILSDDILIYILEINIVII